MTEIVEISRQDNFNVSRELVNHDLFKTQQAYVFAFFEYSTSATISFKQTGNF